MGIMDIPVQDCIVWFPGRPVILITAAGIVISIKETGIEEKHLDHLDTACCTCEYSKSFTEFYFHFSIYSSLTVIVFIGSRVSEWCYQYFYLFIYNF